ncbi:MAG: hypothetical protein RLZZ71_1645 [Bacteroidota bacterium]|jgi:hypothetical protein
MKKNFNLLLISVITLLSCSSNSNHREYKNVAVPEGYRVNDGDIYENKMIYSCSTGNPLKETDHLLFSSDYGANWDSVAVATNLFITNVDFVGGIAQVRVWNGRKDIENSQQLTGLLIFDFETKKLEYP